MSLLGRKLPFAPFYLANQRTTAFSCEAEVAIEHWFITLHALTRRVKTGDNGLFIEV